MCIVLMSVSKLQTKNEKKESGNGEQRETFLINQQNISVGLNSAGHTCAAYVTACRLHVTSELSSLGMRYCYKV
jgi:hypothetical protein